MKKKFNYSLLTLVSFLIGFSLLFFFCLSAPASLQRFGNTYYYFLHQFIFATVAIIAGYIAYRIPLDTLKKWAPVLVLINIIFLFLVFLPKIGLKLEGASRWISIGGWTFQPSEFLKITSILYLAAWIASKLSDAHTPDWKSYAKKGYHNIIYILAPFLLFLGLIFVALNLQKDASTLGIISITLLIMYFSAKTPLWHTGLIIIAGAGLLLLMVIFEPYRLDRWLIFLNPEQDPLGKGFQLRQSLIALGSGGFWGKGLGMSTQKFGHLPAAMSDSLFAILGEELGIIGCAVLIGGFIMLFLMGLKIYRNSNDKFSKLTAIGIVSWISLQAAINMSSVVGIFPLSGIPLPFFSYGGSHILVELIGIGLLLNISKNTS